jgi:hypothetical protein
MRVKLLRASDSKWEEYRDIQKLDDLIAIIDEFGTDLIVSLAYRDDDAELELQIYDDHVE